MPVGQESPERGKGVWARVEVAMIATKSIDLLRMFVLPKGYFDWATAPEVCKAFHL